LPCAHLSSWPGSVAPPIRVWTPLARSSFDVHRLAPFYVGFARRGGRIVIACVIAAVRADDAAVLVVVQGRDKMVVASYSTVEIRRMYHFREGLVMVIGLTMDVSDRIVIV
jgi:hypothetical protein